MLICITQTYLMKINLFHDIWVGTQIRFEKGLILTHRLKRGDVPTTLGQREAKKSQIRTNVNGVARNAEILWVKSLPSVSC